MAQISPAGHAVARVSALENTSALVDKVKSGRFDASLGSVRNALATFKVFVSDGFKAAGIVHAMQKKDVVTLRVFAEAASEKRNQVIGKHKIAMAQYESAKKVIDEMKHFSSSPGLSREASKGAALQSEECNNAWIKLDISISKVDDLNDRAMRYDERLSLIEACLARVSNPKDAP